MDNERRADIGEAAILAGARETNVARAEPAETAVKDVFAYIRHFCDRLGVDAEQAWSASEGSYMGDFEDGPAATRRGDPATPLLAGDGVSGGRAGDETGRIADAAIGMFLEYRDAHGRDEDAARVEAVQEVIEGEEARIDFQAGSE
jgi:hypothetical protein